MGRVVLYARVSKDDLELENQRIILKQWVEREGVSSFDLLEEKMTTRKTRPIKELLMKRFREGYYDTVVVTKIDRFARSLKELTDNVQEIIDKGGRFVAISNGFDFKKDSFNASQHLMFNIFCAFAEFERELIRERTLEGLERARRQGKRLGRPLGAKDRKKRRRSGYLLRHVKKSSLENEGFVLEEERGK